MVQSDQITLGELLAEVGYILAELAPEVQERLIQTLILEAQGLKAEREKSEELQEDGYCGIYH